MSFNAFWPDPISVLHAEFKARRFLRAVVRRMINSSFGGFHALILGGEWSLSDSPGVRRLRFGESFMPSNTLWHGFPMETQLRICKIVQNGPDLQSWVKKCPPV